MFNRIKKTMEILRENEKERIETIINDHWNYVKEILTKHGINDGELKIAEYHYKTAFRHGWKHAKKDTEQ